MMQFIKRFLKVLIIIGLCVYLVALIVMRAPATLVTSSLASSVPQLKMAIVSGSAWWGRSGDANLIIQGQPIRLGVLTWKFKPLQLFALKACVDLTSEVFNGTACRTITGNNQLHRFQADLPASLANSFNRDVKFAGLAGANITQADFTDRGEVSALSGNVTWRGARVNVQNMWFTLGDYAADIEADTNGGIKASLFDLAGPFGVKLEVLAGINTSLSAQGTVLPKENAPEAIKDVLGLFAVPQEDGAFTVKYPL